jgi:hypothetical protein
MATFSVNETARRVQYVSTGQTTYNFNFQVNAASELQVYVNDTLQVDSVSYSATIGSSGSGSIAFINNSGSGGTNYTPSNGDYITIIGDLPLSRTTSLNNAADITTTNLDTEFDNTLFRQQQLKEMMDRSIQLKVTTPRTVTSTGTNGPLQFPYDATVSNNADKLIAYDSNGTSLILGPTSAGLTTLTNIASDVQTLAGISSNITTVAGMQSNISSVLSNATNINAAATNITNINLVGSNASNINTVASDITNVNQLANALNLETTFVVTVANPGSGNVFVIDGSNNPILTLDRGANYIFDLSNSSNAGHPLAFKDASGNSYTTGVTTTGTAGTSGAKVTLEVASNAPSQIRYYCTVHGNSMGNIISIVNNNLSTVAGNISSVTTVAGGITNINTAATNIANINSVAGNATNINAVNSNATNINDVAGDISNINSVAGNSTNINAVAGNSTNINAVNTNSSNINAVAGNATNINTVAGDTTEITAVAGNATNINTVAGNNTNINTVAGANSNITSVAGSITNVNTVATNIADVNSFSNTYRISANAPTTSLDVGDLWFDTTNSVMKVYSASGFITAASAVNGTANRFTYTATANQTTFTGSDDNSNTLGYDAGFVDIYLNGIKLVSGGSNDYVATNGTSIVLNSGAAANDTLEAIAYGTFELLNSDVGDLGNVNTTGLATNDLLRYDGTNFVPKSFDEITPSQSSNSGKFLTTDGTNSSWATVAQYTLPTQTGNTGKFLTTDGTNESWGTVNTDLVSDLSPQLGASLDGNGNTIDLSANNTHFNLPRGTTSQQVTPSAANEGAIRYDTDDDVVYYSTGSQWIKIASASPSLTSVTGNLYVSSATTLTLAGTNFLTGNLIVNFTQTSDSINENVTVTPSSETAATVSVPAAVYNNVTAGNAVTIKVTNSDGIQSGGQNITAAALPSGGSISNSGSYRIHTFTSSGTFTNTISNLSVDYLVIAGGAGGASSFGGGGGAGGYRTTVGTSGGNSSSESAITLSATSHTITVGAGGAGGPATGNPRGASGSSSSIGSSVTSIGGGSGGSYRSYTTYSTGVAGGSGGGGGSSENDTTHAGGAGTSGQGTAGGYGYGRNGYLGGGGGGAGNSGSNASANNSAGNGGNGLSNNITGSSVTRGGGGGGAAYGYSNSTSDGSGGSGGGGAGNSQNSNTEAGSAATANTGGGGGGGSYALGPGGAGGSGIVIIRYQL